MRVNASDRAEQAGNSPSLELLARAGLIAYGVVHLLIGWLALQIAWSASKRNADTSGALATLAAQPFGKAVLWLVAVGMVALALWQVSEVIWGYRNRAGGKRLRKQVTSGARALVYGALGVSAASVAMGSSSSSSQSQRQATATVLDLPGGRVLVVIAGLVIIAAGAAHVVKALKRSFLDDFDTASLKPAARRTVTRLGEGGYLAKGMALGLIGGLLTYATVTLDRQRTGLDGAMQTIVEQPLGKFMLTAVAAGFVAFGLFTILQSRYRRM